MGNGVRPTISSNPFVIQGTAGPDNFYVSTLGKDIAVLKDNKDIIFQKPIDEVRKRGLQFQGSPGDDSYEIGSDVANARVPVRVDDHDGINTVENSAGDWASGSITGNGNNMGHSPGGGVEIKEPNVTNEELAKYFDRQLQSNVGVVPGERPDGVTFTPDDVRTSRDPRMLGIDAHREQIAQLRDRGAQGLELENYQRSVDDLEGALGRATHPTSPAGENLSLGEMDQLWRRGWDSMQQMNVATWADSVKNLPPEIKSINR